MRRSPPAEHLVAPPVARQQLRTAHNALKVCSTVPASNRVRFAAVAPPPEPREATCDCVETKKTHLNAQQSESGYRRWSDFALRQSGTSIMRTPRYGGMHCRDQESLNWLAQWTWLMAADQYLIALAISCIGSFRGEAHIESQASSPCGLPGGVPWTERPDRSTPSAPVL